MDNNYTDYHDKTELIQNWLAFNFIYTSWPEDLKSALYKLFHCCEEEIDEIRIIESLKNKFQISEEEASRHIEQHVIGNIEWQLNEGLS